MKTFFTLDKNIRFNPSANELQFLQNGSADFYQAVKIENRLSRILYVLLNNANQVINRTYFVEIIWDGNNNVGNPALTKAVSSLRRILKKHQPGSENLIETIPKIGYRLKTDNKKEIVPIQQKGFSPNFPVTIKVKTWQVVLLSLLLFYIVKFFLNGSFHAVGHQLGH